MRRDPNPGSHRGPLSRYFTARLNSLRKRSPFEEKAIPQRLHRRLFFSLVTEERQRALLIPVQSCQGLPVFEEGFSMKYFPISTVVILLFVSIAALA